jgi:dTDP-glucose 4,6-dehydratase
LTLKYELVDFHSSRPGHDLRYALSGAKLKKLGFKSQYNLKDSLAKTVNWSILHNKWLS